MIWSLPNSSPTLDSKHFEIVLFRILIWENTPGFNDGWMDLVSSQGSSLLLAELSGLDVTDTGFIFIKDFKNLEALKFQARVWKQSVVFSQKKKKKNFCRFHRLRLSLLTASLSTITQRNGIKTDETCKEVQDFNYGSFFGPSQPIIAQRVIQESKSLLENPDLAARFSKTSHKVNEARLRQNR
ncbi:Leucine-rich repeat family protein [Perilla frutescens var. frutescens]|nr:Leucine-rich repeat family protein [Perilla frutescens var. frutescens]